MRAVWTCLLVAGCGAATPTREAPSPVARAPEPSPPIPAFLVYAPDSTTIVPFGDDVPIRTAPGTWLASVETPRVVVHRIVPEDDATAFGLPSCACGTIDGACLGRAIDRAIHTDERFRVVWQEPCSCWSTRDGTEWPAEPRYPQNSYGESLAPCHLEREPDPAISIVAGSVYTSGWDTTMSAPCARESESLNLYDLWGDRHVLVAATIPELPTEGATHGCAGSDFNPEQVIDGLGSCERDEEDEELEEDPCDAAQIDFTLPLLRNGRWCEVGLGVSAVGQEILCATCVDARPDACPSALDPCGEPTPFAEATETADMFWVSTDGAHALVFGDAGVAVHSRDGGSRSVAVESDRVIGVL